MTDITIPPAALEAGARALARYNCEQWDNDPDRWRAYFTDEARAAFLAMLDAWPGMEQDQLFHGFTDGTHYFQPRLILPLRRPAMTSDLDAKGPAVHSSEHNTERDISGTQAAPQPDNDPSGLEERLLRLAQQFEDQHAPMRMTMLLRDAANRLSNHRTETLEYLGQVGQLSDELERLRAALFEIAGMHELSVHDYSPTTRWWMHQKVARDALNIRTLTDQTTT